MANALMIAAGGGGDAIAAAVLGPALGLTDKCPVVMTYAWDRLIIDPLPGPRAVTDFSGLERLVGDVHEIVPHSRPIPPAGSTLPDLAAELPARLLLLEPAGGAMGMARQIQAAAKYFSASEIALVDVGGDVLTRYNDSEARSPLADLLALAACSLVPLPTQLVVAGVGLDGEFAKPQVLARVSQLEGRQVHVIEQRDVESIRAVLAWHPSEASGLLALASAGALGLVEIRDSGTQINLDRETLAAYSLSARTATERGPAWELRTSDSLASAERIVRRTVGVCEIDYERRKAQRFNSTPSRVPDDTDLARIDNLLTEAATRGASFVSIRRISELIGVTSWQHLCQLRRLLAKSRPNAYCPPILKVPDA